MEHLNYCRQVAKKFKKILNDNNKHIINLDNVGVELLRMAINFVKKSEKFILPVGGRIYYDPECRALDESVPLRLPFQTIALEYRREDDGIIEDGQSPSTKTIVFASEIQDAIMVMIVCWADVFQSWAPFPPVFLPVTGYIDRTDNELGATAIKIYFQNEFQKSFREDYIDEVRSLLSFLNILQCKNVHTEISRPKKAMKQIKLAYPFDTYHILTVDVPGKSSGGTGQGSHRSPREHLRRGHIRRLCDGRRVWVNATVVCAGSDAGVIKKDYAVRCGAGNNAI